MIQQFHLLQIHTHTHMHMHIYRHTYVYIYHMDSMSCIYRRERGGRGPRTAGHEGPNRHRCGIELSLRTQYSGSLKRFVPPHIHCNIIHQNQETT